MICPDWTCDKKETCIFDEVCADILCTRFLNHGCESCISAHACKSSQKQNDKNS